MWIQGARSEDDEGIWDNLLLFGFTRAKAMRKIYELDKRDIVPTYAETMAWQKMPDRSVAPGIKRLMDEAIFLFQELAEARGVIDDFEASRFPDIYEGKDANAPDCPIPSIVALAESTALMAATMGDTLALKSDALFKEGRAALGYMLNVVSSVGADRLGRVMCRIFSEHLRSGRREVKNLKVQYYCPGHCGWHISGQDNLFAALHPDEIGISLNEHRVMHPFKSISGILVAAPISVHDFRRNFSFCPQCKEHKCIERFRLLETGELWKTF